MAGKTLFMETTEVTAEKSSAEIISLLVQSGAREISTKYQDSRPTGLRFGMEVQGFMLQFDLPVRIDPIHALLKKKTKNWTGLRERAERVAWRQLFRWVQAQLAMIQTGMVQSHEVFLPYLLYPGTQQTMFEHFEGEGLKRLTAGGGK